MQAAGAERQRALGRRFHVACACRGQVIVLVLQDHIEVAPGYREPPVDARREAPQDRRSRRGRSEPALASDFRAVDQPEPRYIELKNSHEPDLAARRDEAAKAKQDLLARARKSRIDNSAGIAERQAARKARKRR